MVASSNGHRRLGEVIETTSVTFWAETDELHAAPPLGSLVRVGTAGGDLIYGVVSYAETVGIDTSRHAIRRGSAEVRDGEIYRRHPELTRILRTVFEAVPVGFRRGSRLFRQLPPLPPTLHYSVEEPTRDELIDLTDDVRYLALLGSHTGEVPTAQLIVAHLRFTGEARDQDVPWLERACQELARLFKNDYDTLIPMLEAVAPDE